MARYPRFVFFLVVLVFAIPLQAQTHAEGEAELKKLLDLNNEFTEDDAITFKELKSRRGAAQAPKVAVIACADSRVPPEFIFKQNLTDVFVVRTAGNIVDPFALASLEFAGGAPNNWLRLIIVVGHSDCGALKAAIDPTDPTSPNLLQLVTRIRESFNFPYRIENLKRATEANAANVCDYITAHSTILRQKAEQTGAGGILIVPAYHDLSSGKVTRLR